MSGQSAQPMSRSIPAPAGEPTSDALSAWYERVYPRACGGTGLLGPQILIRYGLSPRLRGNLGVSRVECR